MSKPRSESTKQTHVEQPLDKGGAFWFHHKFRGLFKGTLEQRYEGGDFLVRLSSQINCMHYKHSPGNYILVNPGLLNKLEKA